KGPVVSSDSSGHDVRVVSALSQTNGSRCHPGALPGNTCFRVTALRDVDQLREVVGLARIDGRQIAPFSFSRLVLAKFSFISWKRRWRPGRHWRWRRTIASKGGPDGREQLCRSDERNLHENLSKSAGAFHEDSLWLIATLIAHQRTRAR